LLKKKKSCFRFKVFERFPFFDIVSNDHSSSTGIGMGGRFGGSLVVGMGYDSSYTKQPYKNAYDFV